MLWGLRPVEPRATHGLAVDLLRSQIHAGLLLPAEKLPAERQLSDRFGISRVTLREALRVLETDKYITIRRGARGGAFVTDEARLSDLARRRMSRAPGATMRVVEFLTVNQLAAARFAALRRGPAELKRMQSAIDMLAAAGTAPERKQAEALFLLALADAASNPLLARSIQDGLAELFLPFEVSSLHSADVAALESFKSLVAALEGHSAEDAEAAITEFHDRLWNIVRRMTKSAA